MGYITGKNDSDEGVGEGQLTRRRFLRTGVASASLVALPGLIAACGDSSPSGASTAGGPSGSVTFAGNGGALQDAQAKAFFEPFMKANPKIKIVQDTGSTDYAKLEAMVKADHVTWDLADVGSEFGYAPQQQALLAQLDCSEIECATSDVASNYRVPVHKYASVIGYRPDKLSNPPRTWAEVFDLDALPGKRVFWKEPLETGLLEAAALADGVPIDKLYPLDLKRIFKRLDTIKSSIIWTESPTDAVKAIADGEAVVGQVFSSQAYAVSQAGSKIAVVWNEYGTGTDFLVLPKGGPNKAAAMKLAAYMTSAEHNAQLPNLYPVAPANPKAKVDPNAPTYAYLPTGKGGTSFEFDGKYYGPNFTMLSQKFQEWLQS